VFLLSAALEPPNSGQAPVDRPNLTVRWQRGALPPPDPRDLAAGGATRLVIDLGGAPSMDDLVPVVAAAAQAGLQVEVWAGAGPWWTPETCRRLRDAALGRAVVRLGPQRRPTRSRRTWDPAGLAASAIAHATAAGLATNVGLPLTRLGTRHLAPLLDWVERAGAGGCDVEHLMPDGRLDWRQHLPRPAQIRTAMHTLTAAAWSWQRRRVPLVARTWHGPADPAYVHIWCLRHAPEQAEAALVAARRKGAAWPDLAWIDGAGNVFAVAGLMGLTLGNLRHRGFAEMWQDRDLPGWERTRRLHADIGARCTGCHWREVCRGGERARAMAEESVNGPDPGCCLSDREVAGPQTAAG